MSNVKGTRLHWNRTLIYSLLGTIQSSPFSNDVTNFPSLHLEFDDPITAGNVIILKVKKLLKEDLERNYLMAIYNNRVENFKSVFLIDNILGRIEESENELQDGKLLLYFYTWDEDK